MANPADGTGPIVKRGKTRKSAAPAPRKSLTPAVASTETELPKPQQTPLIVGIGASAGGLDAFKTFFAAMPGDSGMAFVLVQHLDPNHKSILAELVGRQTAMT